jgi:7,8-dihydro-6-hydroxymethylpterin-pyrophosphokinase
LRRAKDERRQWIGQQVLDVDLSLLRRAVDEKRADVLRAVQVERSFVLSGFHCCVEKPVPGFTFSRIAVAEHSDEKTVCHLQAPLD